MSYHIDLGTLLLLLADSSGSLQTDLHLPKVKGLCHARLALLDGNIMSCSIESEQGTLFSGDVALKRIEKEILQWNYIPYPSPSVTPNTPVLLPSVTTSSQLPRVPTILTSSIPVQVRSVEREERASWPFLHRSAFNLANGTTSIERIAQLLKQDPVLVAQAIADLMKRGVIVLREA